MTLCTSALKVYAEFCSLAYGATSEQSARGSDDLFRIRMMEKGYTLGTYPTLHLAPTVSVWQAQTLSVPGCLFWVFRVFVEVNSLSVTDWQGKIQTEISYGVHNDGHFQCHKALSIFLSTDISFLGCSPAACAKAHSCGWFIVYPNEEPDNPFISLGFLWVLLFNSSGKSFACL